MNTSPEQRKGPAETTQAAVATSLDTTLSISRAGSGGARSQLQRKAGELTTALRHVRPPPKFNRNSWLNFSAKIYFFLIHP